MACPSMNRQPLSLIVLATLLAVWPASPALAQSAPEDTAPRANPALTLLGKETTSIDRPKTPSDVLATMLNDRRDVMSVPQDVAVEIAPYWMFRGSELTWREDVRRNVLTSTARTLAVSFATGSNEDASGTGTGVSLGLAFSPWSGRLDPVTVDSIEAAERYLQMRSVLLARYTSAGLTGIDERQRRELAAVPAELPPDERQRRAAVIVARFQQERDALLESVVSDPRFIEEDDALLATASTMIRDPFRRTGFMLEFAGGSSWLLGGGRWSEGRLGRVGLWATFSHVGALNMGDGRQLTPLLTVRYLSDADPGLAGNQAAFDGGMRLVFDAPRYGLSFESLGRRGDSGDIDYRLAVVFDVKVAEGVWLQSAFGKDFEHTLAGNVLARASLSIGASRQRYTD